MARPRSNQTINIIVRLIFFLLTAINNFLLTAKDCNYELGYLVLTYIERSIGSRTLDRSSNFPANYYNTANGFR